MFDKELKEKVKELEDEIENTKRVAIENSKFLIGLTNMLYLRYGLNAQGEIVRIDSDLINSILDHLNVNIEENTKEIRLVENENSQ